MTAAFTVYTPFGKFCFTYEEQNAMRRMTQAQLIEKITAEFGEEAVKDFPEEGPGLSRDKIIYVVNKLQAYFLTEDM